MLVLSFLTYTSIRRLMASTHISRQARLGLDGYRSSKFRIQEREGSQIKSSLDDSKCTQIVVCKPQDPSHLTCPNCPMFPLSHFPHFCFLDLLKRFSRLFVISSNQFQNQIRTPHTDVVFRLNHDGHRSDSFVGYMCIHTIK